MALSINDLKNGVTIELDGIPYLIVDAEHVKPGKGSAIARIKAKNLRTGALIDRTYRGNESIQEAFIDEKKLQYLYHQDDTYHFMDQQNFEELAVSKEQLKDQVMFLKDNLEVSGYFYKDSLVNIALQNFIILKVVHTEPGIKGDTAKNTTKTAELETGATIQVPLFINQGDNLKIDTRTGNYVERSV